jgi:hypothetical protein
MMVLSGGVVGGGGAGPVGRLVDDALHGGDGARCCGAGNAVCGALRVVLLVSLKVLGGSGAGLCGALGRAVRRDCWLCVVDGRRRDGREVCDSKPSRSSSSSPSSPSSSSLNSNIESSSSGVRGERLTERR